MKDDARYSFPLAVLTVLLGCLLLVTAAHAGPVVYINAAGSPTVVDNPQAVDAVSALNALAAAPRRMGLTTAVPRGTTATLSIEQNVAVVNFSKKLTAGGIDELKIETIFEQVKWTLWYYGIEIDIRILVDGTRLSDFAAPTPVIVPEPEKGIDGPGIMSLSGKKITLSPGHGRVWNGSAWGYQRSPTCAGTLSREDDHNIELCQYLSIYLANEGMTVKIPRCIDKNYGNHSTGTPWWQMASVYWLHAQGYPCSVYGSTTDCTPGSGANEWNDDIRARPLASDYDASDIYISIHTNALSGDCYGTSCPTGSDMFYDCSSEHASWCTVSTNLANAVNSAFNDTIWNKIPLTSWVNRGVHDSDGAYGEIRIPDRAAILLEVGFHDSCDLDVVQLKDNFFRSAAMWGIYKGVCDYFSQTPTWDFYSDELVSDTIPSTMTPGEVKSISITFRNKGVLWNSARSFKLGAVGDSDPFTTTTRQTLSAEVAPNGTVTFTFNLTAPMTPGTYTTDWRMLREGVTWFGATCSKQVAVGGSPDTEPPTVPTNLTATPVSTTQINLSWTASTDNVGVTGYKIYRNSSYYNSTAGTSYPDTGCSPNTTYSYQVSAYDAAGNESGLSNTAQATTPPVIDYILDNPVATYTGAWSTASSATDKYGADYRYCNPATTETATARWTPNLSTAGGYEISVWYPQGANRSIRAPYTVYYNGGSITINVNQTTGGGHWNLITTKTFAAGTAGYVKLGNNTSETGIVIMADAVRFYYIGVPPPPSEYIIDEEACTYLGTWSPATCDPSLAYNGDYRYYGTASSETAWAKWTPDIQAAANYNVYCMYRAGTNRSIKAPYTVYWNGGSQTIQVNQTLTGGTWVTLVTSKSFAVGTAGYVKLSNFTSESAKVVIADAAKWVKL